MPSVTPTDAPVGRKMRGPVGRAVGAATADTRTGAGPDQGGTTGADGCATTGRGGGGAGRRGSGSTSSQTTAINAAGQDGDPVEGSIRRCVVDGPVWSGTPVA